MFFQIRPLDAGLKSRQQILFINADQTVYPAEQNTEYRAFGFQHFKMAHNAGATATGDDDGVMINSIFQHSLNVCRCIRPGDAVGESPLRAPRWSVRAATEHKPDVAQAQRNAVAIESSAAGSGSLSGA